MPLRMISMVLNDGGPVIELVLLIFMIGLPVALMIALIRYLWRAGSKR